MGCGYYDFSFLEPSPSRSHGNLAVYTLVLMQMKGMIESAEEVYMGQQPLCIDPNQWETAPVLKNKIASLEAKLKDNIATLEKTPPELLTELQKEDNEFNPI